MPFCKHWFSTGGERRVCRKTYIPDLVMKEIILDPYVQQSKELKEERTSTSITEM